MTSDKQQAILARIRLLCARTTANGCTEAEAIAAAEKVRQLLTEYNISMSQVDLDESTCEEMLLPMNNSNSTKRCVHAVTTFTDVKAWIRVERAGSVLHLFGLPSDVQVCEWLLKVVLNAMEAEKRRFVVSNRRRGNPVGHEGSNSFKLGFSLRIQDRLKAMKFASTQEVKTASGRDLMVVKNAVVQAQFNKLGLRLRSSGYRATVRDRDSFEKGKEAGDRVGLNRPIAQSSQQLRIGRNGQY